MSNYANSRNKSATAFCATPQYTNLGTWVSVQRTKYRLHQKGKPSLMTGTEERIRALNGIGFDWGIGRTDLVPLSCASSRKKSDTASCQARILPIPSSGGGFRRSALNTGCIREDTQIPRQGSVFEHSMVLLSIGGQARLSWYPFGAYDFNN